MRSAALGVAFAFAFLASCWVSRKTADFECELNTDCTGGRVCDRGYCVEEPCPGDCTSCDNIAKTCLVVCTNSHHCGSVDCPDGYDCTVQCTASNACNDVRCHGAKTCTIMCTATNACDNIDCGDQPCSVSCSASNACGPIDCSNSCKCDVTCGASGNCDSSCPMGDVKLCTQDGTAGTACNSSTQAGCNDGC